MLVLGIETSCDETAYAVVRDGREILSNIIASQVKSHAGYGGVVPELASRLHIENCIPILNEALDTAGVKLSDMELVAVTSGPGLIGSLLVGVELAKALSYVMKKPLVPVHHIAGHLYTPFLKNGKDTGLFEYPYMGLVVSGGHSSLIYVQGPLSYKVIGRTLDDAAGEAFDKVAKLLDLGYPGGPVIDNLAEKGNPEYIHFPRPGIKGTDCHLSFSGLKTAVVRFVEQLRRKGSALNQEEVSHIASSFQAAIVETLLTMTERALIFTGAKRLAIVGGVACNTRLRIEAQKRFQGIPMVIPQPILCTDNAAMIAGLAPFLYQADRIATLSLNADANLALGG